MHAPPTTPPTTADIRHSEALIDVHNTPDQQGRVTLTAWWLTPQGVRGQVFWTTIADFTRTSGLRGRTVRIRWQPEPKVEATT